MKKREFLGKNGRFFTKYNRDRYGLLSPLSLIEHCGYAESPLVGFILKIQFAVIFSYSFFCADYAQTMLVFILLRSYHPSVFYIGRYITAVLYFYKEWSALRTGKKHDVYSLFRGASG